MISGLLASTGVGLAASVGINTALGGGTYFAEQATKREKITIGGVVARRSVRNTICIRGGQ